MVLHKIKLTFILLDSSNILNILKIFFCPPSLIWVTLVNCYASIMSGNLPASASSVNDNLRVALLIPVLAAKININTLFQVLQNQNWF